MNQPQHTLTPHNQISRLEGTCHLAPLHTAQVFAARQMSARTLFVLASCAAVVLGSSEQGQTARADATQTISQDVLTTQQQRIDMVRRVSPSVVAVFAGSGEGGGSGVLISSDGYALSNFHVTSGSGAFMKCGLNDGCLYDAVIVGVDPTGDVALLKLLGREDFPAADLGDSDALRLGEEVYAMGNPFLLATDFTPSISFGIVSGLHRYQYPAGTILEYTDCIQTDASINPGNSGGPLFNGRGQLVGINGRGSFEKRGRVNSGAGYAISINQIKHFLDHLKSGRVVDHATLGATVRTGVNREVLIDAVLEQSEAFRRGLRSNDELVSFAGRPIGSVNQFKNILGIFPDGWTLPLVYRRNDIKHEIRVQLRPLHSAQELAAATEAPEGPPAPRPLPDAPEKRPAETPDGQPSEPAPSVPDGPAAHQAPKIPEQYREQYEPKPGFANYYFNRQQQRRVLAGLEPFSGWRTANGRWRWTGQLEGGPAFNWIIAESGIGLSIGQDGHYLQPLIPQQKAGQAAPAGAAGALIEQEPLDEPPGSGGLLYAIHQFRLLITRGPEAFTDCYYLGSEPLDGAGERVDVLITLRSGVRSRWLFSQASGKLLGLDSQLSTDVDAARLRFLEWAENKGRMTPTRFTAVCGDRLWGTFVITQSEVQPAPPANEGAGL